MAIPNPLKVLLQGKRNVIINEEPREQVGSDLDHLAIYPEMDPEERQFAPETLTDSNCIFIDHASGVDTDPGTESSPVKTLNKALTLLTSTKVNLCLLDSGYVFVEDEWIPPNIGVYNDTSCNSKIRLIKREIPAGLTDANTYFVDFVIGSDSTGTGSQTDPYKTIQKACDVAYAAGGVDKNIGILVGNNTLTTQESVELIIPSSQDRMIYVLWRDAADTFKAGSTAIVEYKYQERDTSSLNKDWKGYFYEPGKFQQSSQETIYASCWDGANGRIYYSTDGITWNVVATDPLGAKPVYFAFHNYSGTDYLFVGTFGGVYRSTNGLTWSVTGLSSGSYWNIITWNNNVIASGGSGIQRTANGGTGWTSMSTNNCHRLVAMGNYLYFYDKTQNKIRKVDTSWSLSDHTTISEISDVRSMVAFNGKLYLIGDNSTSSTVYFIEVDSDANYIILYSRSYTASDIPKCIINTGNRLYLPNFTSLSNVSAFDGVSFKEVGTTTTQFETGYWNYRGRVYFNFTTTDSIKYFLTDCINIVSLGSGTSYIWGLILDGNDKKAEGCIRSADYAYLTSALWWNKFINAHNTGVFINSNNATFFENNIVCNLKNAAVIGDEIIAKRNLLHNISEVGFDASNTSSYVYNSTFDLVSIAAKNMSVVDKSIFSRVVSILENDSSTCRIEYSVIQFPYTYVNASINNSSKPCVIGTPIFRNRDAFNADYPDYRLQAKWCRPARDSALYYKFSSAGVGLVGSSYEDAGCYSIRRQPSDPSDYVIENGWEHLWECDFYPDETGYSISFNNLNEMITVNGIKKPTFEGMQNRLSFAWQPKTMEEWLTIRNLYTILKRNEKARLTVNPWYDLVPEGAYSINPDDFINHVQNNDLGIFSGPTSVEVLGSSPLVRFNYEELWLTQYEYEWLEDEFRGWLVYISYQDFSFKIRPRFYKIVRNTHNTLYLADVDNVYQNPFPTSSPPIVTNGPVQKLLYIIGAMDVRVNTDTLESNLALWYDKANPPMGGLKIEFVEV